MNKNEEKRFSQNDLNKMLFKRCFGQGYDGAITDMDIAPEDACLDCQWHIPCKKVSDFRTEIEHKLSDIHLELQ